jgi:hypothetical protein
MFVVSMLKNLEVYVVVESCHCQNEFFCVVVLGTTVPLICQLTPTCTRFDGMKLALLLRHISQFHTCLCRLWVKFEMDSIFTV